MFICFKDISNETVVLQIYSVKKTTPSNQKCDLSSNQINYIYFVSKNLTHFNLNKCVKMHSCDN